MNYCTVRMVAISMLLALASTGCSRDLPVDARGYSDSKPGVTLEEAATMAGVALSADMKSARFAWDNLDAPYFALKFSDTCDMVSRFLHKNSFRPLGQDQNSIPSLLLQSSYVYHWDLDRLSNLEILQTDRAHIAVARSGGQCNAFLVYQGE